MHETADDLARLQRLLESSLAAAGPHLRSIHTDDRRLDAAGVVEKLPGMRLLVLGTVTADGRPLVGPVDGIFYRGHFHFSTSPDSVRMAHIRARPSVSATHMPGEELAVTVHGRAVPVDLKAGEHAGLRACYLATYTPRYGDEWEEFLDSGPVCCRIEAEKMFAIWIPELLEMPPI
ncbi:MAG: pyridoxamine 5'-phosphate oxidase family protein [Acidimicrobiales bacterium]